MFRNTPMFCQSAATGRRNFKHVAVESWCAFCEFWFFTFLSSRSTLRISCFSDSLSVDWWTVISMSSQSSWLSNLLILLASELRLWYLYLSSPKAKAGYRYLSKVWDRYLIEGLRFKSGYNSSRRQLDSRLYWATFNDRCYYLATSRDVCISYSTGARDLCDILHRSSRALCARVLSAICRIDPECTCYN